MSHGYDPHRINWRETVAKGAAYYLAFLVVALAGSIALSAWQYALRSEVTPWAIGIAIIAVAIVIAILLIGGAAVAWRLALIFGMIGGFGAGVWGAVTGVAIAGAFGAIYLMFRVR